MKLPIITVSNEQAVEMAKKRRSLPIVTVEQFEALHLFAHHYEVLGVLLTMPAERVTELLARGYQTKE